MTRVLALCGAKVVRLAAAAGLAATLAGCYTAQQAANIETVPTDYRQRHPITLQEGRRTVEVFVGNSRGALTPEGRADVLAFAQTWKREATGGILIDVPSGTPNERAAGETTHEIQSILTSAGVPPQGIAVRPYRPADLAQPRADGEVYGARRATVLDKYRQGQSTETQYPNATRGRISNVGN